jgi:integral membrane protein
VGRLRSAARGNKKMSGQVSLNLFDLRTSAKRFRFVAFLEALTWLGLLVGMAFKYLPAEGNDLGVKIFGPLHGAAFLVYLPICAWTIRKLRWGFVTGVIAILAGFPPFGTFLFEVWAARTGRMAELSARKLESQCSAA